MHETVTQFFMDKFYFIVVTVVFIFLFMIWVQHNFEPQIKEFLIALSGAWLALIGVKPKPNTQIQADNIATANTESGDIVTTPTSSTKSTSKE